jgi:flagellar assembly protein FliH
MSNPPIPKEQMTPYERWELPNFGAGNPGSTAHFATSSHPHATGRVALPTAAEVEQIQQQAHEEGYQAGYAAAAQEAQRMAGLVHAMEQAFQQLDQQIAQDLLALSLEVARQMLQQSLRVHPEMLLNVINSAIGSLPHFNQGAHLIMHPDDAVLVRAKMGDQLAHSGWKIFENAQIQRGGVKVETANSQIDATLATRWQHIVAALGQDNAWLQENERA